MRGARHELMRLAGELRHMPEPRPCGVALAERLLTEPSSPLYTAASSDEVARAARDAADRMRADEPPAPHHAAPREWLVREAPTVVLTTRPPGGEPIEHHFCIPTVAPLPARVPAESADW